MSSNLSLFIKRAELFQNEDFIKNVFERKQIGDVSSVEFIKKQSNGKDYNGVIVHFKTWYHNSTSQEFLDKLTEKNESIKFQIDKNAYWYININTNVKSNNSVSSDDLSQLSGEEKIKKMEALISNLMSQLYLLKKNQEKRDNDFIKNENKNTQIKIYNNELEYHIAELKENENVLNETINDLLQQNKLLTNKIETLNEIISYKNIEINELKQENSDLITIEAFYQAHL